MFALLGKAGGESERTDGMFDKDIELKRTIDSAERIHRRSDDGVCQHHA